MTPTTAAGIGPEVRAWPRSFVRDELRRAASARVRAWFATLLISALAASVYAAFVGYGYNLDDEGTILYQILRTHRGQRPYLDFHTGYTPAVFYLNALLFDLFGVSVIPLRAFLVAVNTLSVALIFRLALRLAPPAEAACAALTYAFFLPFFGGQFASFNIPYPAWYAVAAWLGAQLASVKAVETGRRFWLAAAGLLCGVAFSFKPNTGLMALGAAVLSQLLVGPLIVGRLGAALETALLLMATLAVFAAMNLEVFTPHFGTIALPLVVLLLGATWLRRRARREVRPGATRTVQGALVDAACLLGGFLAVNYVWLAYFLPRMGLAGFGRDVLLLGAGVERIYLLYFPLPNIWTVLLASALVLSYLVPRAIGRSPWRRRLLGWLGGLAVLAMGVVFYLFAAAPEGVVVSIGLQLENLSFVVIPIVLAAAVLKWLYAIWSRRPLVTGPLPMSLGVATVSLVYALLLFLQLYPRIDFMHVVVAMPSALVIAAGALYRAERWWVAELGYGSRATDGQAARAIRIARVVAMLPIALALLARCGPMIEARVDLWGADAGLKRLTSLGRPQMPVSIERDRDHDLRELRAVAAFVSRETRPGDAIFAFPALGIIPFLTDRETPVPHDYFFPGRPEHAAEAVMTEIIHLRRPPLVVTLNDRYGYFSASPAYYFILRKYVQGSYTLVRRIGRFDVLMRNDLAAERPDLPRPSTAEREFSTSLSRGEYRQAVLRARRVARRGTLDDLVEIQPLLSDVDRQMRGRAVEAILAVAAREPGGLDAVQKKIAPGRRARLILLRGLGEYAPPSVLPYLYRAFKSGDGRIQWEAGQSINFVLVRELAGRYSLTEDVARPLWDLPPMRFEQRMLEGIDEILERQRLGPLAALLMAQKGRTDLAWHLDHFEERYDTSWWRIVGALALVRMDQLGSMATLLGTINEGTLGEHYVPPMMIDPWVMDPARVASFLGGRLRNGTPAEREVAAWMAPYLTVAGKDLERALAAARNDPLQPMEVRVAADWALRKRGGWSARPPREPRETEAEP